MFSPGTHLICATVTSQFLEYTKAQGNDLSTPKPQYRFPGLKPGDNWCLCVYRWHQAIKDGAAPNIVPAATNRGALTYLQRFNMSRSDLVAFSAPRTADSVRNSARSDFK